MVKESQLSAEEIENITLGIQLGHRPPKNAEDLYKSPITLTLRAQKETQVDLQASSRRVIVAEIYYARSRTPRVVRAFLFLSEDRVPERFAGGSFAYTPAEESWVEMRPLVAEVIDGNAYSGIASFGRNVVSEDLLLAHEVSGSENPWVQWGCMLAYFAHEVAFTCAAEADFPMSYGRYPELRSEGVAMSDLTYMGIYGYIAVARWKHWLVLVEYIKTEHFDAEKQGIFRGEAYEYFLPDLDAYNMNVQGRVELNPASVRSFARLRGVGRQALGSNLTEAEMVAEYRELSRGSHLRMQGTLEALQDDLIGKALDKIASRVQ